MTERTVGLRVVYLEVFCCYCLFCLGFYLFIKVLIISASYIITVSLNKILVWLT